MLGFLCQSRKLDMKLLCLIRYNRVKNRIFNVNVHLCVYTCIHMHTYTEDIYMLCILNMSQLDIVIKVG